jgi:homoserine kinase type II
MDRVSSVETQAFAAVLRQYPGIFADARELQAAESGLSGANVWRLPRSPGEPLCLRRWPAEHPTIDRLRFIHAVLEHVKRCGVEFIPAPISTSAGATVVQHDGRLWELTPWLPGQADYLASPSPERLRAAMRALAAFHRIAAGFERGVGQGVSQGMSERAQRLAAYHAGNLEKIAGAIRPGDWPELAERAGEIVQTFTRHAAELGRLLARVASLQVAFQPVIRDIHDEHVLFTGNKVTGLIDFGAMRIDTVASDIARLLGSMAAGDQDAWTAGLAAYRERRPLSDIEIELIAAFDLSTVVLGPMLWVDWIYLQRREFADRAKVLARIDRQLLRMRRLPWRPVLS